MTSRPEAIEYLQQCGFHANARDWAFGESIIAASGVMEERPGLISFRKVVYIYPKDGSWSVCNASSQRAVYDDRRLCLRGACDAAMEILKSNVEKV